MQNRSEIVGNTIVQPYENLGSELTAKRNFSKKILHKMKNFNNISINSGMDFIIEIVISKYRVSEKFRMLNKKLPEKIDDKSIIWWRKLVF